MSQFTALKRAIMERGYTQTEVARRVPVTRSYLNQIVNKRQRPTESIRRRLSVILAMDAEELFPAMEDET